MNRATQPGRGTRRGTLPALLLEGRAGQAACASRRLARRLALTLTYQTAFGIPNLEAGVVKLNRHPVPRRDRPHDLLVLRNGRATAIACLSITRSDGDVHGAVPGKAAVLQLAA